MKEKSTSYSGLEQLNHEYEKTITGKKENAKTPPQKSKKESTGLRLIDFYKMSSTRNTTLPIVFLLAIAITAISYFLNSEFKLHLLPALNTLFGCGIAFIILLTIQLALLAPIFINALKLKSIYTQLPFKLSGLDNLIHSHEKWIDFSLISVKLSFTKQHTEKQDQKILTAEEMQEVKRKILQLIVKEANRNVKRSSGWRDKSFFENKHWIIEEDGFPAGYANCYVLGKILLYLDKTLNNLQSELGIIQSVDLGFYQGNRFAGQLIQQHYQLKN